MTPLLAYDDAGMFASVAGAGGADRKELARLEPRLQKAEKALEALREGREQGFFNLPFDLETAARIEAAAEGVRASFDRLIVIGIGGSDLGARTIAHALGGEGVELVFLGNPDPETLAPLADKPASWWKKTAVNVVSKSGSTLETMSVFMFVRALLIKAVGDKRHARQVFATTDPDGGILFDLAGRYGYEILPHPPNVGGRFSVLSVVGLFPSACAGVPIRKLLSGAGWVERTHRKEGSGHMSARFAALHYLAYAKRKQRIHVLMPYADALREFGAWYRQIWAESLGKETGKGHVGPTPVAALGTVDQHSQIQLYNQGPNDKVLTFVSVGRYRKHAKVPKVWKGIDGIGYIGGRSFAQIMHAELDGTARALATNGRPTGELSIPTISPETLGALFQFFELATAYAGELFGVSAYNQPGVKEGKRLAKRALMKRSV